MDRRTFSKLAGMAAAMVMSGRALAASQAAGAAVSPPAKRFEIGMVMFDNMTNLDLVGPADMFSRVREARVHLIGATLDPIRTDSGMRVLPSIAMRDVPQLDLLFIPGGPGTAIAMEDPQMLDFVRKQAAGATWVTSVCTGALVLGAAGLLKGYKAATHWTAMDLLPLLGATPVHERVVKDRNRITGGGVTAGIDFGLTVIAEIWGVEQAQLIQLGNEYDPKPPFNAGSPQTAPAHIVARFKAMTQRIYDARRAAAQRVRERLG